MAGLRVRTVYQNLPRRRGASQGRSLAVICRVRMSGVFRRGWSGNAQQQVLPSASEAKSVALV